MASFEENFYRVLSYIRGNICEDDAKSDLQKLENFRDYKDDHGFTLLHHSVIHGNAAMVKYLIERGCNVNVRDKCGNTPLILATKNTGTKTIKLLLEGKADMYLDNNEGVSSFHLAAQHRLVDSPNALVYNSKHHIFDMFVDKICEEFSTNERETISSMLRASDLVKCALVVFGSVELASFLLENGYTIDFCQTIDGFTALHWAVYLAKKENVKLLIKYGANVYFLDAKKNSPLYFYTHNLQFVDQESEVLIEMGTARITTDSANVLREIEHLLKKGNIDTVRTILKIAGIDTMNFSDGQSILHVLIQNTNDDVIDLLVELNIEFDVNARTKSQMTALMIAASHGYRRNIEFLLNRGANAKSTTSSGRTALYFACQCIAHSERQIKNLVRIVELLLQHGADVQIPVFRGTILDGITYAPRKKFLAKVIMAHLALKKTIEKVPLTNLIREKIEAERIYRSRYDLCVKEIEHMKNIEVHKKISLFELLGEESEKKMLRYARDQTFVSAFNSAIKKISSDSYYFRLLEKGIKKVIDKIELDKKAAPILGALTGLCCDVYRHIIYKIISYLEDQDLNNLCQTASVL